MYLPRRQKFRSQYTIKKTVELNFYFFNRSRYFRIYFFVHTFAWYAKDRPSPSKLAAQTGYSTVFLTATARFLYDMYKDKNVPVTYDEIPKTLGEATIAIEDKNFYKHGGFSQMGMIRAVFNMFLGKGLQSGSTTQQLIKMFC